MRVLTVVLGLSFVILMYLFAILFIKDIGRTEILDRIDNYTYQTEDMLGLSDEMKTHIHEFPDEYSALDVPIDLYFFAVIISTFIGSLISSYKAKEQNMFSFFGMITIGVMFLLFLTFFIDIINTWFIYNFIAGVMEINISDYMLLNFYITNLGIINLAWFVIIILVNKLNFTNVRESDELVSDAGGFQQ